MLASINSVLELAKFTNNETHCTIITFRCLLSYPPITTSTLHRILARMGLDYYTPSQLCHTHLSLYLLGKMQILRQNLLNPLWHPLLHILPHLRLLHRATHARIAGHIGAGTGVMSGVCDSLFVLLRKLFLKLLRDDVRVCGVGCLCSVGHGGRLRRVR